MRVLCIFPVTNNYTNISKIMEIFKTSLTSQLKSLGATTIEIKFAGTDYIFISSNSELKGEPKGKGILECLKNVSEAPNIVISCDGSNKIPYSYIVTLYQELISDTTINCVMANRKENKAISDIRYLIERFEVYSLKKYHNMEEIEIPDGQCGLWGYRYGKITINDHESEIKLTAQEYGIELDLLSEVLEKKLNHSFIDVNLPNIKASSSFEFRHNIEKIKFLIMKYNKFKDCILNYFGEFEKTEDFLALSKEKNILSKWDTYKKELVQNI